MRPDLLLVKDYVSSLSMPKRHTVPPSGAASPPPRGKANRFRPPHTAWRLAPQPGGFFDESFVQLFTWVYFVGVCLDSACVCCVSKVFAASWSQITPSVCALLA